jgi:Flp pilus assembly pilin Flp
MEHIISNIKSKLLSYRQDTEGAAAVEFALVSLAFMMLLLGTLEMGRMLYIWNNMQYTLEQATRTALVTADVTEAQIQQFITDEMVDAAVDANDFTVTITFTTVNDVNFVEVIGMYDYDLILPFVPSAWDSIQLPATSRMVLPDTS